MRVTVSVWSMFQPAFQDWHSFTPLTDTERAALALPLGREDRWPEPIPTGATLT